MEKQPSCLISNQELSSFLALVEKWGWSSREAAQAIAIDEGLYSDLKRTLVSEGLNDDQQLRVYYLLAIDSLLHDLFSNPENIYGFINMSNDNNYFNGKSPKEKILGQPTIELKETLTRIKTLVLGN